MYTQTSEAIKAFKNQNEPYTDTGSGSQTATQAATPENFGAFDPDFDISKTVNEIEQVAHHVKVNIEDNLGEPLVNIVKDNLVRPVVKLMEETDNLEQKMTDSMSNIKASETLSSQTVNLDETVRSDPLMETGHDIGLDKIQKVDGVSLNKVDFDKVGDLGLAGPKISVTENVVDSFKSSPKQPKQPKTKNKIMSNFKPQVSGV